MIIIQINYILYCYVSHFPYLGQNKLGELLMNLRNKLRVPLPSTEPIFHPKNIPHTNSYSCSSDDDNTTYQRNVIGQVSSPPTNEG